MMDLSKYYFLSHILDELHDIKNLIAREIIENAPYYMGTCKI